VGEQGARWRELKRFGVGVCRSAPCAGCFAAGGSLRRSSRLVGTMRLWQMGLPCFRTSGLSDRRSSFSASYTSNNLVQPASRTGRPQRWEFEQRLAPNFTFPADVRAKTNSSQRTSAYFPHGAATFILTGFHRITFKPLSCAVRCWSTSNNLPAGERAVWERWRWVGLILLYPPNSPIPGALRSSDSGAHSHDCRKSMHGISRRVSSIQLGLWVPDWRCAPSGNGWRRAASLVVCGIDKAWIR
jgi:hypothetical protein